MDNSRQIKHLYARAGFGIRFEDLHDQQNWLIKKTVKKLFKASEVIEPLNVLNENIDLRPKPAAPQTDDEKRALQEEKNKQEKALNNAWVKQLSETNAQLREKMTLFWHNHF
ncbi:MAG: hypothetical protein JWQ06_195, partial [Mucilaginibacter sp.]|nr:hypothetical protein [Mucilaginibacter sp.]